MNSNRELFLKTLEGKACPNRKSNPESIFAKQGVVINRIVRDRKPESKILPRVEREIAESNNIRKQNLLSSFRDFE
ncbi:unnamed protein product [Blepharisma stoltei]|uniref:Uncharacterized protein n=1 Tax=Blepharisma stoltei TaxID=1481888 RepID=A0AAU9IKW9_9CILI|nr:unnamed protein product [Blepharisma stoltei]